MNQTLYNGQQTAKPTVGPRETLRVTGQTILLNAATFYMDLLRDAALVQLQ
jgi:outer membrane protein